MPAPTPEEVVYLSVLTHIAPPSPPLTYKKTKKAEWDVKGIGQVAK